MLRGGFPWHRPPRQVCPEASLPAMSETLRSLKSAPSGRHDGGFGLSIIQVNLDRKNDRLAFCDNDRMLKLSRNGSIRRPQ